MRDNKKRISTLTFITLFMMALVYITRFKIKSLAFDVPFYDTKWVFNIRTFLDSYKDITEEIIAYYNFYLLIDFIFATSLTILLFYLLKDMYKRKKGIKYIPLWALGADYVEDLIMYYFLNNIESYNYLLVSYLNSITFLKLCIYAVSFVLVLLAIVPNDLKDTLEL